MANRNFRSQFSYSYAGQPVVIRAKLTFGSSGAVTLASGTGMGITSITKGSDAGEYAIVFSSTYASLMGISATFSSGTSAPAAPIVNIETNTISTAGTPTITLQCRNISAAVANPASGEIMYLEITLNNSSTGY